MIDQRRNSYGTICLMASTIITETTYKYVRWCDTIKKTGFIVSAHRPTKITLLTLIATL